ncbi:MAG: sulfatase-like hydrolase/transferase, partial [Acidimicrobiia bacterium]|nr:sulfatase-like hydrolase/transferase [Acidimicrobiia bacterium]
ESLIVVTADHGAAFVAGETLRGASEGNYQEVAWVPLLVKAPRQGEGERRDVPARSVDLLPTIADHLDADLSWDLDGASLLGPRPRTDGRVELLLAADIAFGEQDENPVFDREEGFERVLKGAPPYVGGRAEVRPYRLGRLGGLVGRKVDELDVAESAGFSGRLTDKDALADVDVDDEDGVPSYVTGEVESGRPLSLAVSVNGVIGGWSGLTRTYADVEDIRRAGGDVDLPEGSQDVYTFRTFVPPSLLRDGRNDVEVFVVEGGVDDARLRRVAME